MDRTQTHGGGQNFRFKKNKSKFISVEEEKSGTSLSLQRDISLSEKATNKFYIVK